MNKYQYQPCSNGLSGIPVRSLYQAMVDLRHRGHHHAASQLARFSGARVRVVSK